MSAHRQHYKIEKEMKDSTLVVILQAVAAIAVIASIGVMLAWRG